MSLQDLSNKMNLIKNEKDTKIIPGNIKKDVTIFDVTGSVEELNGETKTVKSTTTQQTITPTSGKNGITEITVEPISLQNKTVTPTSSQQIITADNGYDGLGTVTVEAGGGSQYSTDWSTLGYNFVPTAVTTSVNYSLTIMQNWDNTQTNTTDKFLNDTGLVYFPTVDMSNVTNATRTLKGCSNLVSCAMLNFDNIDAIKSFFENCTSLEDVPQFDLSNATTMTNMFSGCSSLTDDSLNNIMGMCINATKFMQTQATRYWTLAYMGLSSTQATRCQSLSNYTAFINAGWTTGY